MVSFGAFDRAGNSRAAVGPRDLAAAAADLQAAILEAMEAAMLVDRARIVSPYVSDGAAKQFIAAIDSFPDFGSLLRKPFHDA